MRNLILSVFVVALVWLMAYPCYAQLPNPKVAVACRLGDQISVVDASTIRVVNTFSVGRSPLAMVVSPDGRFLVVTLQDSKSMVVVEMPEGRSGIPVAADYLDGCCAAIFSPDGARLYLLNQKTASLIELHVPSFKFIRSVQLQFFEPTYAAITPDGQKMYISHPKAGSVSVVDLVAMELSQAYRLGASVGGLDISGNQKRLVVALPTDCVVGVYEADTMKLVDTVPVGQGASAVRISKLSQVVVLNSISNDVSIFNISHPGGRYRVAVGVGPRAILFTPDGAGCFVTNYNTNDVSVISMQSGQQLGRLAVGKGPQAIVWLR